MHLRILDPIPPRPRRYLFPVDPSTQPKGGEMEPAQDLRELGNSQSEAAFVWIDCEVQHLPRQNRIGATYHPPTYQPTNQLTYPPGSLC